MKVSIDNNKIVKSFFFVSLILKYSIYKRFIKKLGTSRAKKKNVLYLA